MHLPYVSGTTVVHGHEEGVSCNYDCYYRTTWWVRLSNWLTDSRDQRESRRQAQLCTCGCPRSRHDHYHDRKYCGKCLTCDTFVLDRRYR